ncbi:Protein LAS1 [Candida viswanathii]|uniref:Protein LAS1 n=1 Tax=Candida viswanathii TaxID=5486 RepID=A0A367XNG3_9ASCO|nr:Protein LAS1 [Candida viswanathii]
MQRPTITAYRSIDDLRQLKQWFYDYNEETDNRLKAVQKVKGLATRGKLPHGVEATSFLTTMVLNDNELGPIDSNTLQLSYTMALIRFVNGLLDPFQQSNYAIPMHLLAKQLNLPTYFVELRHMGTHESLPSLDILRITCGNALNWLYEYFWSNIENLAGGVSESAKDPLREVLSLRMKDIEAKFEKYQVYNNLKTFKRIRKQDLDKVYMDGDETDPKYNKCLADIVEFANEDMSLLVDILLFKNYLIYPALKVKDKRTKFNPLIIKLYLPMLDKLGVACKLQCFDRIIDIISDKLKAPIDQKLHKRLGFAELSDADETVQLIEWLAYLGQRLVKSEQTPREFPDRDALMSSLLDGLQSIEKKLEEALLPAFTSVLDRILDAISKEEILRSLVDRLSDWIKLIKNLQSTKKTYELPPSLDDLLGLSPAATPQSSKRALQAEPQEDNVLKKKQHVSTNETPMFLLTPHENWKPTPFGTCV